MPSTSHETFVFLFEQHPALVVELLRLLHLAEVPQYASARIQSAELSQLVPTEYRADLLVLLEDHRGPRLAIVLEIQLRPDGRKRFTWPLYQVAARAKLQCPVVVLVLTPSDATARWAAKPVQLGGGNTWQPLVLPLSRVPPIDDRDLASRFPELAVLSVMAHGRGPTETALPLAEAALSALDSLLDPGLQMLYFDLIHSHLGEAAKKALSMLPKGYQFQSEFGIARFQEGLEAGKAEGLAAGEAKGLAAGKAEGLAAGERSLVRKLLRLKFGPLPEHVEERLDQASHDELSLFGERVLSATSLDDVFG